MVKDHEEKVQKPPDLPTICTKEFTRSGAPTLVMIFFKKQQRTASRGLFLIPLSGFADLPVDSLKSGLFSQLVAAVQYLQPSPIRGCQYLLI
jgi:hypothetical protein